MHRISSVQEDSEFRQVAELLAAIADRVAVSGGPSAEVNQVIRDWLLPLAESDVDIMAVLAEKLERAFPI
jgi:hypothetical protein